MRRQSCNLRILNELEKEILDKPDYRFIQILWAMGIITRRGLVVEDRFYEEPEETLKRVMERLHEKYETP